MVTAYFNTSIVQNMMVSGKMGTVKVMAHIIIQMVTNSKEIGKKIFNKEWAHIIMLMVIFIRDSGKLEKLMVKAIIFIRVERLFIRVIGKTAKSKDLASLLFRIIMDIRVNGKIIKSKAKAVISTLMGRNMMGIGAETRNQAMARTNIRMAMFTSEDGRTIEDRAKAK